MYLALVLSVIETIFSSNGSRKGEKREEYIPRETKGKVIV